MGRHFVDGHHPALSHALDVIQERHGEQASVAAADRSRLAVGNNANVGTTLVSAWDFEQDETFVNDNSIDTLSSDVEGDTGNELILVGYTISGGLLTRVVQTAVTHATDGRTKVVLDTPLARCCSIIHKDTTAMTGTLYVYEDGAITLGVPDDLTTVHCTMVGTKSQSFKGCSATANDEWWIITGMYASVKRNTNAIVDFTVEAREVNDGAPNIFRTLVEISASQGSPVIVSTEPYLILPNNSDFRIRAISTTSATEVFVWVNGYVATTATGET